MSPTTPTRRFAGVAVLFALALACLALASSTHDAWPLFVAWIPLIGVPWLLTRPEAGARGSEAGGVDTTDGVGVTAGVDVPASSGGGAALGRTPPPDPASGEEPDSP